MKGSLMILSSFAAGVLLASCGLFPEGIDISNLSGYILYLLMLLVGLSLGLDSGLVSTIKSQPVRMLLLPISTMVGTFVGALIAWGVLQMPVFYGAGKGLALVDAMSVSSGFGYYSLSSILLNEARGAEIGTMALAANIIRELLTIVCAPLLVRLFGPLAPVSAGGATTMDTTLPIIQRCSGNAFVPVSIFHGVVMDFSVPLFLTLFVSLS